jgi:hypothetical protein
MSLTKLILARKDFLFPARESLFGDIPPGDGEIANLFLQCTILLQRLVKGVEKWSLYFSGTCYLTDECTAKVQCSARDWE